MLDSHKIQGNLERYRDYLLRAMFYNAFGRTVVGLSGFVMQKEPQVKDGDKLLDEHLEDVTMGGEPLSAFTRDQLQEILITGRGGILVDFPDNAQPGARPYWSAYRAEDIISWRTDRIGDDPNVLTRVVLREFVEEEDLKDPFKLNLIEQYRVLRLVAEPVVDEEGIVTEVNQIYVNEVWRKTRPEDSIGGSNKFILWSSTVPVRFEEPLTFIPFVPLGATSLSITPDKPPLLDLADLNLSHYRTMADLEHGRHFTALPTPWVAGLQDSDDPLEIGSGTAWILNENGKAGMLEFTGAGLESLTLADDNKSKKMAVLGARLLEGQSDVGETATAILMRHAGEGATLRSIVSLLEQALTKVVKIHVWWIKRSAGELSKVKASIELNKDFFAIKLTPQEIQALLQALQADAISFETFYHALMTGGWTRPGVSSEEEKAQIEEEGGGADLGKGNESKPPGEEDDPDDKPDDDEGDDDDDEPKDDE
jgi:hypothetical protein